MSFFHKMTLSKKHEIKELKEKEKMEKRLKIQKAFEDACSLGNHEDARKIYDSNELIDLTDGLLTAAENNKIDIFEGFKNEISGGYDYYEVASLCYERKQFEILHILAECSMQIIVESGNVFSEGDLKLVKMFIKFSKEIDEENMINDEDDQEELFKFKLDEAIKEAQINEDKSVLEYLKTL